MGLNKAITFLAITVLTVVGSFCSMARAASASITPASSKKVLPASQSKTVMPNSVVDSDPEFHMSFLVSRSTSLVDFKDGSRKDGMDYELGPSLRTSFGTFAARLAYSQNLREDSPSTVEDDSDFADVPITFAFKPTTFFKMAAVKMNLTPKIVAVVPISKISTKRDQLQTALIGGVDFSFTEGGVNSKKDSQWVLGVSLTAGRSFHAYEENINGTVLNQYLSNQGLNAGYKYKVVNFGVNYVHRTRWSYQGNVRDSFELGEEIGWEVNDAFSAAIGHTNAGSTLKPDGSESNYSLYDENSSMVYVQMGISF